RANLLHRDVQCIDIFARAQSEAEMVQPDAPLIERHVTMLRGCGAYQHARASANAIECIRLIILDCHAETLVEQLVIKRPRLAHIAHSKLDMGDAVELDHLTPRVWIWDFA